MKLARQMLVPEWVLEYINPDTFEIEIDPGFKLLCIDVDHKPNDIPLDQWVEDGQTYTVKEVLIRNIGGAFCLSFKLEEISMETWPYDAYQAQRFLPL